MKLKAKQRAVGIRLIDEDGETMEFKSVADAANFLEVTRQAVLQAAKLKGKCRGCRVEKTEGERT